MEALQHPFFNSCYHVSRPLFFKPESLDVTEDMYHFLLEHPFGISTENMMHFLPEHPFEDLTEDMIQLFPEYPFVC